MAFALMDDQIHGHPKFARAGLEAVGLWSLCLSYCSAYLTDGYVSREVAERFAGRALPRISERLVSADLWEPIDGGWTMHDYLDWNPSRAEVTEKRQAERDRKAKGRNGQGRDMGGRITSARIPLGQPPSVRAESESGHTGSHAHAHSQTEKEKAIPPAGAHARGPSAGSPILDAWLQITGNFPANTHSAADMVRTLRTAADIEHCEPAEYIHAFVAWAKDCPPGRRPQIAPHKLVENFAAVQEWRRGDRKPTAGERPTFGARRHNDGIGAQPVTKEEEY